jgi:transposase-like protein
MRKEDPGRRFSREFKIAAVQRMAAGANVSKLARELGISRKGLYQWQKQFRAGGPAALRGGVGPPRAARRLGEAHDPGGAAPALPSETLDELSKALARIGELERLVGQQAADLDFFQEALQHVGKAHQRSGAPGGTTSTRSSSR